MRKHKIVLVFILIAVFCIGIILFKNISSTLIENEKQNKKIIAGSFNKEKFKTDDEWKKILTPEQFRILREKGTEVPFTGELLDNKESGTYYSVGCDEPVFHSSDKFDSNTGWPSFIKPINEKAIVLEEDYTLGMKRIEVLDPCGGHLGHVFDDGPAPTGKRYCINSIALYFVPDKNNP